MIDVLLKFRIKHRLATFYTIELKTSAAFGSGS